MLSCCLAFLFKIIMPINIDRFEELLITHPNCPFVNSVCRGLHEGFWPWADTHYDTYPSMVDDAAKEGGSGFLAKAKGSRALKGEILWIIRSRSPPRHARLTHPCGTETSLHKASNGN
ncbi:hypothetical protein L208DRAFT_1410096 [Tricholoma matsutake]|nr:hypothetical protein L208DRAFT_1410096 [Tricholoma matsutake 945]